jgi:DNA-binding NtrC family response regulator
MSMSRILVVDDEDEVRDALKRRLEREEHSVQAVASAAEGVAALQSAESPFDVVITDMSMEEGNSGIRILKASVARDVFTEVIVLTAYGNVKNAVECMQMGAYDYVEKNIPDVDVFELLMLKIDRALQQRRATVRTLDRLSQFGHAISR